MDDIVIEETMTYVARELGPMYAIKIDKDQESSSLRLNDIISENAVKNSQLNTNIIRP
jgi:hypothetical protein